MFLRLFVSPSISVYVLHTSNCFLSLPSPSADKIQISGSTFAELSRRGGFQMEERGEVEIKVRM